MDFAHSPRVSLLQTQLRRFIDDSVLTAQAEWQRHAAAGVCALDVIAPLQEQARALGLWNLFLADLREHEPGTRLSNLDYAQLAEVMKGVHDRGAKQQTQGHRLMPCPSLIRLKSCGHRQENTVTIRRRSTRP